MEKLIRELLKNPTRKELVRLKKDYAQRHRTKMPLNSEILAACSPEEAEKLRHLLITKPQRTISGVSVVAIMSPPAPCPGNCVYCPQGPEAPKSYTGFEPATMRARLNKFDPFLQVQNRLSQLAAVGHPIDKCELIIMGGTFPALPWKFQQDFVARAFEGFNLFEGVKGNVAGSLRERWQGKKEESSGRGWADRNLSEAQKRNETAKARVVGLTIETRPEWVFPKKFLKLGCTRVELGVQSVYPEILRKINRGHGILEVVRATRELKNHGFKVLYHLMPGLPGSNFKKDLEMFRKVFSDPRFKPDMLKIYPTLVIKGTKLYEWWKSGQYKAIDEKYMEKLLKKVLKICPKRVRIMRVQRDIPAQFIEAGPKKSNLREIVEKSLAKEGVKVKEIRFREAGRVWLRSGKLPRKIAVLVEKYRASRGWEYFISAEDVEQDILVGFCRLRIAPSLPAFVRELHVYGAEVPIGMEADGLAVQHRGWGRKLLAKAEEIAREQGKKEILVISGIGVREYYRKLGYKLKDRYMWKVL